LDGIELCVGCWAWGDRGTGISTIWASGTSTPNTLDDNRAALQASLERGVRLFDTAEMYSMGRGEEVLGAVTAGVAGAAVATKFVPLPLCLRQSALRGALVASLARLRRPAVDLYQVHGPAYSVRRVEVWAEGLADVYHEGLARGVGVSNYNSD
jgi:pyridoxine 4-dehydrogenase